MSQGLLRRTFTVERADDSGHDLADTGATVEADTQAGDDQVLGRHDDDRQARAIRKGQTV
jgi:hypothetical protein